MELFATRWHARRGWDAALPDLDGPATLVLAFGRSTAEEPTPPPEVLAEIMATYPRSVVTGCSTAGQILGEEVSDASLTVLVARFAGTRLVTATETISSRKDSHPAAVRLGRRLTEQLDGAPLGAVLVLSDGLTVNGSALVEGLVEGTGGTVPVSGGLAGDDGRFAATWVLAGGVPVSGVVTAVGLAGPHLRVAHGSQGGWETFGPVRKVTRSAGPVLFELDGQPALDLYEHYLGERAAGLPATALLFPLALRAPGAPDVELVRTVLGVDAEARSMTFAGDVPEGSSAQLMTSTLDGLVDGAAGAVRRAREGAGAEDPGPTLALAVSCVGRRLVLGRRTEDELEAVTAQLPADSRLVGFYAFGEISPVGRGQGGLHNQTMTVTTITESR